MRDDRHHPTKSERGSGIISGPWEAAIDPSRESARVPVDQPTGLREQFEAFVHRTTRKHGIRRVTPDADMWADTWPDLDARAGLTPSQASALRAAPQAFRVIPGGERISPIVAVEPCIASSDILKPAVDPVATLAGEMAEIYALKLLLDLPFSDIEKPHSPVPHANGFERGLAVSEVLAQLRNHRLFDATDGLNQAGQASAAFRHARLDAHGQLTLRTFLRGPASGSRKGALRSHFLKGFDTPASLAAAWQSDGLRDIWFGVLRSILQADLQTQLDMDQPTAITKPRKEWPDAMRDLQVVAYVTEAITRSVHIAEDRAPELRPDDLAARLNHVPGDPADPDAALVSSLHDALTFRSGRLMQWIDGVNARAAGAAQAAGPMSLDPFGLHHTVCRTCLPQRKYAQRSAPVLADAIVAGACVTMIKALFELDDPLSGTPDMSRLGHRGAAGKAAISDELDKLAENMAIASAIAGASRLSDCFAALQTGQAVALTILRSKLGSAPLRFRDLDGNLVRLANECTGVSPHPDMAGPTKDASAQVGGS